MSTQSNKETKPQVPAQSDALKDEQQLDSLSDEQLDAVAGGAVVLGTGGIEVSYTPTRRRLLPIGVNLT